MTGSLQIKNNKYYAVLNITGADGKRRQKRISTELEVKGNKKRAAKILENLIAEYEERNIDYDGVLFADYLIQWLERVKNNLELSTYNGYYGNINKHIVPYFKRKKIRLTELKPYHLED